MGLSYLLLVIGYWFSHWQFKIRKDMAIPIND
jgi:hypothetical protein